MFRERSPASLQMAATASDIGYNSYDGQSSGVTNANSAPAFDHPGIDGPANAAIFGRIGNQGMGDIKAFTIGSVVGGALGAGGLAVAGYASASTIPSIMAPLLPAVPGAIEKLLKNWCVASAGESNP